jgi:putative peptidoglycan lipid II flippase
VTDVEQITPVPDSPPPAGSLFKPILAVTLLTVGFQVTTILVQAIMARVFGAGKELDAYFAAIALPQYVSAILVGVLSAVCVPIIVSTAQREGKEESRRVAHGITVVVMGMLLVLTAACALFSSPLLRLTAPGLPESVHDAAARMAWILWPTVIGATGLAIATSIDNADHRFVRAALVPLIGGVMNVVLLLLLVQPFGVFGAAAATTVASIAPLLLFTGLWIPSRESMRGLITRPGVREALSMVWPLILSGLFVRVTIVAERYFGSQLTTGSITEISYASRLIAPLSLLLTTGVATVLFPGMSRLAAAQQFEELSATLSTTLRMMWVVVAPVMLIGIVLARPLIGALYEGGRFSASDADDVAALLRVYLLALAGAAIGVVTARVLYALKALRLVSIAGVCEGVAYVIYSSMLLAALGASGVAWAFVIYVTGSVVWHLAYIGARIGFKYARLTFWALLRTTLAALAGGLAAWSGSSAVAGSWAQTFVGGGAGALVFVVVLAFVNQSDTRRIVSNVLENR